MPVVATAGHVDHGKSTLITALTGRDPDRWEEEKRRGLTIDLGFAWMELPGGRQIGFVDVPGHERFIKNMLAGVEAVDAVLFVVAADEGWKPQSEEHLAVVDLLGIHSGVVALTRADLVDEETLELAELEVRDRLEGTSLAGAPIVPVAAPIGRGVAEIAAALDEALSRSGSGDGRPRLWIDRSFVIGGAGTVVTGTLTGGSVAVGDTLVLWPGEQPVRVRGIQTHERSVQVLEAGSRAALNLAGVDRREIPRGAMLGRPGHWRATRRFTSRLQTVRFLEDPLRDRGAFHLHAGSGAWPARLRRLAEVSGTTEVLVTLDDPIPLRTGDRFVVRDVGRRSVVAGGIVLDPAPPQRGAAIRAALPRFPDRFSPDEAAGVLLQIRGRARLEHLAADSGGGRPAGAVIVGDTAVSAEEADRIGRAAAEILEQYHAELPLRPGMPKAELSERLSIEPALLEGLAALREHLIDDGATVRLPGFGTDLDPAARERWEEIRHALGAAGTAAPRRDELGIGRELLHALVRTGRLIEVSDELVYLPETLDGVRDLIERLPDGFTVAEFRDAAGITRRHAVPLLEWLDAAGITHREGDRRTVRRWRPDGPAPGGAPSR